jgi:crotonobetainyl-CoA:carnitine CoA-transferase CaiB-like acyl-CoA transferase
MKVLDGTRVLDLGRFITAPYAAMLLAELGADVVKIEKPLGGDPFRAFKGGLYAPHFRAFNRNKRSLALDYASAAGREVLERLVKDADVMLVNVRPGAEEKADIGPARMQALNSRLVYCSITGFGSGGPYASRPAYDTVGQAASGWLSMFHQGHDARIAGPAVADLISGLFACMGVLGALVERQSTGRGRKVEVSMLEASVAFATEPLARIFAGEPLSFYSRAAESQSYIVTCRDGKRVALHLSTPIKFWRGLAAACGRDDLLQRYPDHAARVEHYEELARELSAIFGARDRDEWLPLLEGNDVPFAPERSLRELPEDPQAQFLEMFYELQHRTYGPVKAPHRPIRYDGDKRSAFLPPPALGEHSRDVLIEAGLSEAEIDALEARRVIGSQT